MSRWMIFFEWTYSSARATCRAIRSLSGMLPGCARFDGVTEILSDEELHHHERAAFFLAEIEDLDDVLVLDVAGHARFLEKARFGLGIGAALFREDLDGDGAADDGVRRPVDMRHAAAQEFF